MNAEVETYARHLRWVLEQLGVCLRDLTAAHLNWRPSPGTANSAYAIVNHVIASTRVYALGFGCGQEVERDRPAEFAGTGGDVAVVARRVAAFANEVESAILGLAPARLDERIMPPRELWGTGELHEISRRDALVESIRHAALHLGELRLTRDLALLGTRG